ncbi:MAG: hypothetical protein COY58_07260 [Gammaproteobacteria bacterium CG_4_10_14_0_8_um_filter_38_16]|nr:MAG: hypothetical protein COY58_07260 [Gammaproteobacteria bacterium CG_4_10_14_0_8_um_filter_38_16]PJA02965.1 MAG: hypothetical protein COX72_07485 [Gammaproteobacteria bacterium CG_4_10_14_0_2_um_filter_38_22]
MAEPKTAKETTTTASKLPIRQIRDLKQLLEAEKQLLEAEKQLLEAEKQLLEAKKPHQKLQLQLQLQLIQRDINTLTGSIAHLRENLKLKKISPDSEKTPEELSKADKALLTHYDGKLSLLHEYEDKEKTEFELKGIMALRNRIKKDIAKYKANKDKMATESVVTIGKKHTLPDDKKVLLKKNALDEVDNLIKQFKEQQRKIEEAAEAVTPEWLAYKEANSMEVTLSDGKTYRLLTKPKDQVTAECKKQFGATDEFLSFLFQAQDEIYKQIRVAEAAEKSSGTANITSSSTRSEAAATPASKEKDEESQEGSTLTSPSSNTPNSDARTEPQTTRAANPTADKTKETVALVKVQLAVNAYKYRTFKTGTSADASLAPTFFMRHASYGSRHLIKSLALELAKGKPDLSAVRTLISDKINSKSIGDTLLKILYDTGLVKKDGKKYIVNEDAFPKAPEKSASFSAAAPKA